MCLQPITTILQIIPERRTNSLVFTLTFIEQLANRLDVGGFVALKILCKLVVFTNQTCRLLQYAKNVVGGIFERSRLILLDLDTAHIYSVWYGCFIRSSAWLLET